MISHENRLLLMIYHTLFFRNLGKMLKNLSPAAVVIGALTHKAPPIIFSRRQFQILAPF